MLRWFLTIFIFFFHFFTSIGFSPMIYIAVQLQKWLSGECENFNIRRVHISNNKVEKQRACSCACVCVLLFPHKCILYTTSRIQFIWCWTNVYTSTHALIHSIACITCTFIQHKQMIAYTDRMTRALIHIHTPFDWVAAVAVHWCQYGIKPVSVFTRVGMQRRFLKFFPEKNAINKIYLLSDRINWIKLISL